MSRLAVVAVAVILAAGVARAQTDKPEPAPAPPPAAKAKEPTPTLDSLPPQIKAKVIKRAKNFYRLPDNSIVDLNNYVMRLEVLDRSMYIRPNGSGGSVEYQKNDESIAWGITSGPHATVRSAPGAPAIGYGGVSDGPKPYYRWMNGKETPCGVMEGGLSGSTTISEPGARTDEPIARYFQQSVQSRMAGSTPFTVESYSADAVFFRLDLPHYKDGWKPAKGPGGLCVPDDQIFPRGTRVVAKALFLIPTGASIPYGNDRQPLYQAVNADRLRLTPEELAKLLVDGEVQLYELVLDGKKLTPKVVTVEPRDSAAQPSPQP